MGRARRTGLIEDLLFTLAKLPWWMGVVLAIVSYLVLSPIAERPIAVDARPSSVALQAVWTGLATAGQYVLPLVCLVAAALSAWQRRQRRKLVADATGNLAIAMLEGLSWKQFEQLVGEGYRLQDYRVVETGGGGADGGVDLALRRGSELFLVQCKHWRAFKVGVEVVRELYGVMAARGAAGGKVVTSGGFTPDAIAFAKGRNIELVDGPALRALLSHARQGRAAHAPDGGSAISASKASDNRSEACSVASTPSCPSCGQLMFKRVARTGDRVGSSFWGCSAFPRCRGTRPIA